MVKSSDSPFTQPEMEELDYGQPPAWILVLGLLGFFVAFFSWMAWWLI